MQKRAESTTSKPTAASSQAEMDPKIHRQFSEKSLFPGVSPDMADRTGSP
jgi:hypothetical protein